MPVVSSRIELVEPLGSETHVVARVGDQAADVQAAGPVRAFGR